MKQYCFLRHAEPCHEEGSLTARGRTQAASLLLPLFDTTFSSPAARCTETALIANRGRPLIIIPELYLLLSELSLALVTTICSQITKASGSRFLIVSHGGVTNRIAAALFPSHAALLTHTLGHAEGFLIDDNNCTLISR